MRISDSSFIERVIAKTFNLFGLRIERAHLKGARHGLNLNVGSGGYQIKGFVNLDLPSEYYRQDQRGTSFVHYDMRAQALPYDSSTVEAIYCSHVIEHIEPEYVERFVRESFRVLKPGGVLRVVTPDARFLLAQVRLGLDFFDWHPRWSGREAAWDCFIDEISTQAVGLHRFGLDEGYETFTVEKLAGELEPKSIFDVKSHVSVWTFDRLKEFGESAGFSDVIESKFQGSAHSNLKGPDIDRTHPEMSLYVEFIRRA